jgi:hypothetical protein
MPLDCGLSMGVVTGLIQVPGKISNLFGGVARAVVGQKLNRFRYGTDLPEALLNGRDQHVLEQDGINPPGRGRLPITAILGKRHTDTLLCSGRQSQNRQSTSGYRFHQPPPGHHGSGYRFREGCGGAARGCYLS